MTRLAWDQIGERRYETGVDQGVLYIPNAQGVYDSGEAWNGLTTVTESPSGAESNPQYADNIKYLNLLSSEEFGATIEAFTYPESFAQCDGTASPVPGVAIGQQPRKMFGLSYRTKVGNDLDSEAGYKVHLVYGCQAAPSERAHATVNDSPEALSFSWTVTATKVAVAGYKPVATLSFDSTKVDPTALSNLEDFLYGTEGADPTLPAPADVIALFTGTVTTVTPVAPTYDSATHTITIPTVTGVNYYINGELATGAVVITEDTVVTASPAQGYVFPAVSDNDWLFTYV